MKTSAVGVREGRQRRASRKGFTGGQRCSVGRCSPHWASGELASAGHVPVFRLIARRAHCKRLITAFPGQASAFPLPADGRGGGARCSASKSRTQVPTVKFSKNPRVLPQAASVGNGPRVPPLISPPHLLQAQGGRRCELLAGSARRGRWGRRGRRAPGSAPVQRLHKTEVGASGSR